jgi:serine/threonine-protein kinase
MSVTKTVNIALLVLFSLVLFFAAANISSEIILRGELVRLPDLTGKTLEEARAELGAKKISLQPQEYRVDSLIAKGRIISQIPAEGSRIKPHRAVKVVVSEGGEWVAVPKFEGRSFEWTQTALKTAGLRRGHVSQVHSSRHAAGRVLAQDPPPGASVARTTAVDLLVSQGEIEERYIMPDLIAKRADPVIRRLKELGFKVSDIHYSFYHAQYEPGLIIGQAPVQGQRIIKRNEISLEVSK